jgi:hypothetical protein
MQTSTAAVTRAVVPTGSYEAPTVVSQLTAQVVGAM